MAKRKRNIVIRFRVTPEEREMIESKMAKFGTSNMAAYLRKISIDGYVVRLDLPELREMVSLLRRSSNNLNQIAVKAHTLNVLDVQRYDEACRKIDTAVKKITEAVNLPRPMK